MLAAVEVLNTLLVLLAHVGCKVAFVGLIVLVHIRIRVQAFFKVDSREERVLRDYLIQDVEVERQLVNGLDILEQFTADGASNAAIAEEVAEAFGAVSMAAANDDARDTLTNIKLEPAKGAPVKAAHIVVRPNLGALPRLRHNLLLRF